MAIAKEEALVDGTQSADKTSYPRQYLKGIRLALATLGLALTLFLPTAEISIVSTSLITLSEDLDGFDRSSWVITAYLSTFTGFLLLWSKFSASVGLKPALLCSTIMFVAFSAGCGASKTITHLIICRAFQGIAGSGMYSLPSIAFFQLVPPEGYNKINALSSIIMASGIAVSPLLGGGISQENAWRWIFYLNVPAGGIALLLLAFALPARFPNHHEPSPQTTAGSWPVVLDFVRKSDFLGASILIGAIIFLVTALEEGGTRFAWGSGTIIAFLVVSAFLFISFATWTWFSARRELKVDPTIPQRFLSNKCLMAALFGCFLTGAPITIASIELPQRFQLVNDCSPLEAGVRLLFYAIAVPIGIVIASSLTGRVRIPFVFVLVLGGALQIIGFALISTVSPTIHLWTGIYGYCVVAGVGVGMSAGTYYMMVPIACAKEDQHLALGLGLQARMLGGAVGIAIVNSVWVNYVRSRLASVLLAAEIDQLMSFIGALSTYPTSLAESIRRIYGDGYNLQMRATIGFSAAQVLVIIALWRKRPYRLSGQGTLE